MGQQFCHGCGSPLRDGFKFCEKCGAPVRAQVQEDNRTVLLSGSDTSAGTSCRKCGNLVKPGMKFCEKCGTPIEGNMMGSGQQPLTPPPVGSQSVRMDNRNEYVTNKSIDSKSKKSNSMIIIVVVLIILLLVVLGVGGFLIFSALQKTPSDTPVDPDPKPETEISQEDHVYELVKANITWTEAQAIAEEKGGYLACIKDEEEEKEITEYLKQYNDLKVVYIGAQRSDSGFKWVSGETFDYTDWCVGEPNNTNSEELYVCLYSKDANGEWSWNDCPNDMFQKYNGQFSGYTAYLIEYNSESDKKTSTDDNNQTTNESGASDTAN